MQLITLRDFYEGRWESCHGMHSGAHTTDDLSAEKVRYVSQSGRFDIPLPMPEMQQLLPFSQENRLPQSGQ